MVQAQIEARTEVAAPVCRHHWLIESAIGPVSRGKCRACGVEKEFKNYLETTPWGEDTPLVASMANRYPISVQTDGDDEPE